ncbi:MAG: hypothetical protein MJY79_01430 [Bacteroidaceae bacterium]|nr:hypothetical protein [Bacteroidaceae bacterium]
MKKFFFMAAVALSMGVMVSSCGGDEENDKPGTENSGDNNGGNGGDNGGGTPVAGTGLKVSSFGGEYLTGYSVQEQGEDDWGEELVFHYDGSNLVGIESNGVIIQAEGDKFVAKEGLYKIIVSDFKTNSDGYITSFNIFESSPKETYNGIYSFEYSGNHMTKMVYTINWEENDESGVETDTYILTWSNDNLTKVACTGQDKLSDDEVEEWSDYYIIGYGQEKNAFKQYTFTLADILDMEGFALPMFGVLGEGPALLPVQITNIWDEEEDDDSENFTLSYTFNDNGTIATETEALFYDDYELWSATCRFSYSGSSSKMISRAASTRTNSLTNNSLHQRRHAHK